jgi:ketosteroid isomerase-like protein
MNDNKEIARALYAAFGRGDIGAVLATLAPDVQWTEAEGGPYGGVSVGPDAVLANVFMKLGGEWDGYAAVPQQFVAEGDTVVALGEYSGTYKATGKSFKAPFAHVWTFRDGKAIAFRQHTDTAVHQRPLQGG